MSINYERVPSILFSYWDGSALSYLNYLTFVSFRVYHPDWRIQLYVPTVRNKTMTWGGKEQKTPYTGRDYMPDLLRLGIEIISVNFADRKFGGIDWMNRVSEVFKSDYLRLCVLASQGGVWTDMDILYLKSLGRMDIRTDLDIGVCVHPTRDHYSIGFLMSSPNSPYFEELRQLAVRSFDRSEYQSIGCILFKTAYPDWTQIAVKYPHLKVVNIPFQLIYPVEWNALNRMYRSPDANFVTPNTVGVHWFNGADDTKSFVSDPASSNWLVTPPNPETPAILRLMWDVYRAGCGITNEGYSGRHIDFLVPDSAKTVSIVMTHKTRLRQLRHTLKTIAQSRNVRCLKEVVVVDDARTDAPIGLSDLVTNPTLPIKLITVTENKGQNPCWLYNIGFREVTGDIVLIQNAECCHVGDVVDFAYRHLQPQDYFAFSCQTLNSHDSNRIWWELPNETERKEFLVLQQHTTPLRDWEGWYNHPIHHPSPLHFCSAIHRSALTRLGGFDEAYAEGIGYDDNEFLYRVQKLVAVSIIPPETGVMVVHQFHDPSSPGVPNAFVNGGLATSSDAHAASDRNRLRYAELVATGNQLILPLPPPVLVKIVSTVTPDRPRRLPSMPFVSIVMAYFNRKPQLEYTLVSIGRSAYKRFEVIVVDDASEGEHSLATFPVHKYQFPIKIMCIPPGAKTWSNPCVPFNMGIKAAQGDIIILQNPECCHAGDVLSFVAYNLKQHNYYSFACRALPSFVENQKLARSASVPDYLDRFRDTPETFVWYNHPKYRPTGYHFCSAVWASHLLKIGGFDEAYADGYCYDDDDLLLRIKHQLKLDVVIFDEHAPFVLHQYHPPHQATGCLQNEGTDAYTKWLRNKTRFETRKAEIGV